MPALAETSPAPGFGIYLHWPFCAAKCPYCDFNSHVSADIDQQAWARAYRAALEAQADETGGCTVDSVFFGGGTPSLMAPQVVETVLDTIAKHWKLTQDTEITLEANPTSVEASRFAGYRAAGVNRLSLGVQALDDADLKRLGRMHDVAEALDALTLARQTFGRVSFDLIYARQDQSLNQWKGELERALSMGPDHLSLYQLTIEPGTAFGARAEAGKLAGLPGDALAVEMYALTQEMCDTAGLEMYEVSNHAKKGQESRHNLIYWQSGDWLGIGPGAHGRLTLDGTRITTMAPSNPREWLSAPLVMARETLPLEEQAEEALIMGLRLRWGIDLPAYEARYGVTLNRTRLTDLISLSLVELDHGNLRLTPDGWPLLNTILLELSRD